MQRPTAAVTRELDALRKRVEHLESDTMTHDSVRLLIAEALMAREGQRIDAAVADERARNIVTALTGYRVAP